MSVGVECNVELCGSKISYHQKTVKIGYKKVPRTRYYFNSSYHSYSKYPECISSNMVRTYVSRLLLTDWKIIPKDFFVFLSFPKSYYCSVYVCRRDKRVL